MSEDLRILMVGLSESGKTAFTWQLSMNWRAPSSASPEPYVWSRSPQNAEYFHRIARKRFEARAHAAHPAGRPARCGHGPDHT